MNTADELLVKITRAYDKWDGRSLDYGPLRQSIYAARAYLNEKPHEPHTPVDVFAGIAPVPGREWIPVGERLPVQADGDVLAVSEDGTELVTALCCRENAAYFTHWMPLPAPAADK